MSERPSLHVAAAVIERQGQILIARRPDHLHQGGLWEFPGGKVELGESVPDALVRELHEEVDIEASHYHPLIRIHHDYGDRKVLLDVWRVTAFSGEAHGREGQEVRWVGAEQLPGYDFPAANGPIVAAARLPNEYLITPEPQEREIFLAGLDVALERGIRLVQLRAKGLAEPDYLALARQVLARCRGHGAKLLLNADPRLLQQVDADGIHLDSTRLMSLAERPVAADKWLAASCHHEAELAQARRLDVDFVVVSPVQATASHPGAPALGWETLQGLTERATMPVYALGGMGPEHIERAHRHGAQGIAAIRGLWEKP
jgi:8-oxo-dGTP diphosphatase